MGTSQRFIGFAGIVVAVAWAARADEPAAPPVERAGPIRFASEFAFQDDRGAHPAVVRSLCLPGDDAWFVTLREPNGARAGDERTGKIRWMAEYDGAWPKDVRPTEAVFDADRRAVYVGTRGRGVIAADPRTRKPAWVEAGEGGNPAAAAADHVALAGDTLVAAGPHDVRGLDPATGKPRWRTPLDAGRAGSGLTVSAAPAGANAGPVVARVAFPKAAGRNPELVALDARDGARLWAADLGDASIVTPPAAVAGLIVHATATVLGGIEVAARDARDGKVRWTARLDDRSFPNPGFFAVRKPPTPAGAPGVCAAGDGLYLVDRDSIAALDPATGKLRWTWPANRLPPGAFPPPETAGMGPPALIDGRLFVSTLRGAVGLDPATGRPVWEFRHSEPGRMDGWDELSVPPIGRSGLVYIVGGRHLIVVPAPKPAAK